MKEYIYERTANYYETDKMQVVHHSNYIRWFEEARVDFMQKIGLPYDKMEESGIMMPVLSCSCDFKGSVRFGETVEVVTSMSRFNGFKVFLEYIVRDRETGAVRTTGSSSHCFTDTDLKPLRIKYTRPEIYAVFERVFREQTSV